MTTLPLVFRTAMQKNKGNETETVSWVIEGLKAQAAVQMATRGQVDSETLQDFHTLGLVMSTKEVSLHRSFSGFL